MCVIRLNRLSAKRNFRYSVVSKLKEHKLEFINPITTDEEIGFTYKSWLIVDTKISLRLFSYEISKAFEAVPNLKYFNLPVSLSLQVFFRGATVNAIRGFPMSATMFLGYELSLKFFRSL